MKQGRNCGTCLKVFEITKTNKQNKYCSRGCFYEKIKARAAEYKKEAAAREHKIDIQDDKSLLIKPEKNTIQFLALALVVCVSIFIFTVAFCWYITMD